MTIELQIALLRYGIEPPTRYKMKDIAKQYDMEICDYIDNAWEEPHVKPLVFYDNCCHRPTHVSAPKQ